MSGPKIPLSERFWSKVDIAGPDECWEWQSARTGSGHGAFTLNGRQEKPHRLIYRGLVGPIPPGNVIRHRCDNPPCVNPAHLEAGTVADNVRDRVTRGRSVYLRGEEHPAAKLTARDVREIRSSEGYGICRGLAEKYGVSYGHIRQLRMQGSRIWSEAA